jgi:hypothetical protein
VHVRRAPSGERLERCDGRREVLPKLQARAMDPGSDGVRSQLAGAGDFVITNFCRQGLDVYLLIRPAFWSALLPRFPRCLGVVVPKLFQVHRAAALTLLIAGVLNAVSLVCLAIEPFLLFRVRAAGRGLGLDDGRGISCLAG